MCTKTLVTLVVVAVSTGCESVSESMVVPELDLQTLSSTREVTLSVTGSGHYTASNGLRTFSFQVRQGIGGVVEGSFQLVGHLHPINRLHGRLTCLSVLGNEAWIGGVYDQATNANLIGTGFGFYVKDNGEGRNMDPDLLRRHVRGQVPEEWCSAMPDVSGSEFLYPVEAGNIVIHAR
jgi:hypothetical protein